MRNLNKAVGHLNIDRLTDERRPVDDDV